MSDLVNTIRDLVATCRDSEEGFGKAAKGTHDDALRNRLIGVSRQRADFADELAAQLEGMGAEAPESGHESGILHRGWRELEASIRPKDDAALLAECATGEENTLRHYEHALTQDLPPAIRATVERHRLAIQAALLEVRNLEPLRKAG